MLRPEQTALLQGLPSYWRYALTGGNDDAKRCFQEGWNERGNGLSLDAVLRINDNPHAGERWISRKLLGVGVITGEESNGLLVLDFDGVGSQAVRAFRAHFHRNPSELPATIANVSGKKGRCKLYYQVPSSWWPQFENRSATWRGAEGNVVMEAIWANGTGKGRHAVIVGDHPESSHQNPLWYRWVPGHGPNERPPAEAPEWLLLGILARIESASTDHTREERLRMGEDDATPWERMTSWERRQLVEHALPYCPVREGKGSGTYEKVRRILCSVMNEFGIDTAKEILCHSDWNKRCDWGQNSSCESVLDSLWKSKVSDEAKSRIASLFFFARANNWQPPTWALPPVELKQQVEALRKALNEALKQQGDKVALAATFGRVKREFGLETDVFRRLMLEHYLGGGERTTPRTLAQIESSSRTDNVQEDLIDGVLGRRVHVLAGASHSGKTTLACFLANRVVHGEPIDIDSTRHTTPNPGKVLIFTSDCSDSDMLRDLALEGVLSSNAHDQVRICSGTTFDDMLFICKCLEEFAPDLVIYDCLTSMACADVRIGDPSYADPIRLLVRHNGVSWPKCAHLILHHTTRDEPTRFSGTEQIKAATEEMWLYYPPELLKWKKGTPRPQCGPTRHLVFEKSRSGYQGRTLCVTRNAYEATWQVRRIDAADQSPIERLTYAFRAVQHDDWRIASEWRKELDLEFKDRSLRRYLDAMVGTVLETSRHRSATTGRIDTHYRPRDVIRVAATEMRTNRGDGINQV